MLRPTKRGSIQTKFQTNPDFAVALTFTAPGQDVTLEGSGLTQVIEQKSG
jgi:hypothetical protein